MGLLDILRNRKGILGINKRNLLYIRKYNKRRSKEIADNKLLTKKILRKANVPTPNLLNTIKDLEALRKFDFESLPNSFVMKPVFGLEGGGIDIFFNRDKAGRWIRANGSKATTSDLYAQMSDIINGRYSLSNQPDLVMIEERIQPHKAFKYYSYKGVPDIRIISLNQIPVMGMLRLPTKESEGKANLSLGAVGAGIDIAKGITTTAISGKHGEIEYIPGTNLRVSGLKIPYWDKILQYTIETQAATKLNYAAIDFLIDREKGPVIVEINARPGLSIQLANQDGQRWRLRKAFGLKAKTTERKIRIAKDLFGGEIEEEVENITGKEVIGINEKVTIKGLNDKEEKVFAKIDTGADSTSIDIGLAERLGYGAIQSIINDLPTGIETHAKGIELMKQYQDKYINIDNKLEFLSDIDLIRSSHGYSLRPKIVIEMKLQDTLTTTRANVFDRSHLAFQVIIGRKSLGGFLVDPGK